jgi:hypothetical protein
MPITSSYRVVKIAQLSNENTFDLLPFLAVHTTTIETRHLEPDSALSHSHSSCVVADRRYAIRIDDTLSHPSSLRRRQARAARRRSMSSCRRIAAAAPPTRYDRISLSLSRARATTTSLHHSLVCNAILFAVDSRLQDYISPPKPERIATDVFLTDLKNFGKRTAVLFLLCYYYSPIPLKY